MEHIGLNTTYVVLRAMAKPFQIAISDPIQDYVQADANAYGRSFSESLQRFTDIGDRCMKEYATISKLAAKNSDGRGGVCINSEDEGKRINAYMFMQDILKNRPDFGPHDKVKSVTFNETRYEYYWDRAAADGNTLRFTLLQRCTVGILMTMHHHNLVLEIQRVFNDKDYDGRFEDLTNKQNFVNYLNEHIFAAVDADKQEAFEEAKRRFLAALDLDSKITPKKKNVKVRTLKSRRTPNTKRSLQ